MKTYTRDELKAIIAAHEAWSRGEAGGQLANLTRANLTGADLTRANLTGADLTGANLTGANLTGADLTRANLTGADLTGANLTGAYLTRAYLIGADLTGAHLTRANLTGAYLIGADLTRADLTGAYLIGAGLTGAHLTGAKLPHFLIVPQQGAFIGWKKTRGGVIKIEIPADARRCNSLVGRKCRAEFVRTLAINDSTDPATAYGLHDEKTAYSVGEITRADSYDDDIRVECTHGIHFFITREEAEEY